MAAKIFIEGVVVMYLYEELSYYPVLYRGGDIITLIRHCKALSVWPEFSDAKRGCV